MLNFYLNTDHTIIAQDII